MEYINSINWGLVWSFLTLLSFCPIYLAPVSRIMFMTEYGREKGEKEWLKFTWTCITLFFIGIGGVWYCAY